MKCDLEHFCSFHNPSTDKHYTSSKFSPTIFNVFYFTRYLQGHQSGTWSLWRKVINDLEFLRLAPAALAIRCTGHSRDGCALETVDREMLFCGVLICTLLHFKTLFLSWKVSFWALSVFPEFISKVIQSFSAHAFGAQKVFPTQSARQLSYTPSDIPFLDFEKKKKRDKSTLVQTPFDVPPRQHTGNARQCSTQIWWPPGPAEHDSLSHQ